MSEKVDLYAIEARVNEATAGEWRVWTSTRSEDRPAVETAWSYESDGDAAEFITDFCSVADAEFIAHARTDVPALIARVRELEPRVLNAEPARDGVKKRWNWGDTNDGDYTSVECQAGQFKPDVQIYYVDDNGDGLYMSWHAAVGLRDQLNQLLRYLEQEGLS